MATSVSLPQHKGAAVLRPPRTLRFTSLVGITFFCVAGGAYGLEDAVGAAGPAWALLAILVVPWVWSLPMALMTAELTAAMPEDGGYVVWVERAFGQFWAFQEDGGVGRAVLRTTRSTRSCSRNTSGSGFPV